MDPCGRIRGFESTFTVNVLANHLSVRTEHGAGPASKPPGRPRSHEPLSPSRHHGHRAHRAARRASRPSSTSCTSTRAVCRPGSTPSPAARARKAWRPPSGSPRPCTAGCLRSPVTWRAVHFDGSSSDNRGCRPRCGRWPPDLCGLAAKYPHLPGDAGTHVPRPDRVSRPYVQLARVGHLRQGEQVRDGCGRRTRLTVSGRFARQYQVDVLRGPHGSGQNLRGGQHAGAVRPVVSDVDPAVAAHRQDLADSGGQRNAAWPVIACPTTRVCISLVPS